MRLKTRLYYALIGPVQATGFAGGLRAVENPLRGFPTGIYSLLRALVVRQRRTTRTLAA